MTVHWGDWQAFDTPVDGPLHEVDRVTARAYFDALMAARPERKRQIEELLGRNGVEIAPSDQGLQRLNDWYRTHVTPNDDDAYRVADRWLAVGLDIGLYLGDAVIARAPNIEWRLFTQGRRNLAYQRPVLMGFRQVENERYNVDPEILVGTHGHRLIAGEPEPRDLFVQIVQTAVQDA